MTERGKFHFEFSNQFDLLRPEAFPSLRQNAASLELGTRERAYHQIRNQILAALTPDEYERLSPHFEHVELPRGRVLIASEEPIHGVLRSRILRYTHALFIAVSQTAACNSQHRIEARLARWLLTLRERVEADQFPITHDFMARMLGANRATVSLTAATIQQAGYISYKRGKLTVLDREGLEDVSCECYGIVKKRYEDILKF